MTQLANIPNETTTVAADDLLYLYAPAEAAKDRKVKVSNLRAISKEETLTNKTIGTAATTKPVYASLLQLVGAKITHLYRAVGNITISALAAGAEEDLTLTVTGAAIGDHVIVSPAAAPEAGVGFVLAWVSAANTVSVRVHNFGASGLTGGAQSVAALVVRSGAADA